jgi:hypothetical protein
MEAIKHTGSIIASPTSNALRQTQTIGKTFSIQWQSDEGRIHLS